ncbi:hypothetical protein FK220_001490 [Flavobacteriaceae bacterium TP-CH-4]|uniref:Uncharacterized protein n=1 Tax=Pelagihabitans pacificus TaxID=2696054 RepID=A0A967E5E3_9FLAO|nr:hypothetical protein [Pelagihabitans pacificus]NHF57994.1 hypothetical protein [Pelagihabitans pacificus]
MNQQEDVLQMANEIEEQILADYTLKKREKVKSLLSELTLEHVMARSEWNLLNARKAILTLADGQLNEIPKLVKAAKIDFRDVIYWVWQKNNPEKK